MLKNLVLIFFLALSACMMVGPDYKEPAKDIAAHWQKNDSLVKGNRNKNVLWWNVFHDQNLTALINEGYQKNLSVQMAGVRVLQARAQLAQSVGELYPQQQAMTGNYNYNRLGGNSLQSLLPPTFDTATLGFTANWEIDFWGKYRRAIQSNNAAFLASVAAYDNVLVTLTADIASTYINLRTTQALIVVTQENVALQAMSLKLTQSRYRAGQTSLLDVEQAKTELAETQAGIPALLAREQHQKDALAVLLGTTPDKIDGFLLKHAKIPKAPSKVAVGIPRETLARRPDIHQARLEAMMQSAAIGVAKASLFPSLSLAGTFVFAANTIGTSSINQLFNWSNRNITAGPALNWPLLNYGQITNSVRVQDATFQQALLSYLNLVLQAQQEVQDNISSYIQAKKTEALYARANGSAIKSTKLTLIRYREGESNYTTVLDAERQQLRVQTSLVNAQGDVPQALVSLYRSLGGGWEIRRCNDVVSPLIKAQMSTRTNWGNLLVQNNHLPPATQWQRVEQLYLPNW